jgi:hypothetical protein
MAFLGAGSIVSVALVAVIVWSVGSPSTTPVPTAPQAQVAPTPVRVVAAPPSPSPIPQTIYAVGQPVAVAGVETHTVVRVENWGGRDPAPPGERYLAVEVRINAAEGKNPKFDQLDYTVGNAPGDIRNAMTIGRDPQLSDGQLTSSGSVDAWVSFRIPDHGPFTLEYAYPLGHDGEVVRTLIRLDPISKATPEPTPPPQPRSTSGQQSTDNWGYPSAFASTYYSGYGAISPQLQSAVTFVGGSWTQPVVSCDGSSRRRSMSIWVGIEDAGGSDLQQLGTGADCEPGTRRPFYYAWYEMFPSFPVLLSVSVRPGDRFTSSVTRSGDTWTLIIANRTTGKRSSTEHVRRTPGTLALWIVEAPSTQVTEVGQHVLPLAKFATVTMTSADAVIGGIRGNVAAASWAHFRFDMTTVDGVPKAAASGLKNGGSGFTSAWRHE